MKYFELLLIPLVLVGPTVMYFAYDSMSEEKSRLEYLGYICKSGKEVSGPSHTRDAMYLCIKDGKTVTVGVWGKPVNMKYRIDS